MVHACHYGKEVVAVCCMLVSVRREGQFYDAMIKHSDLDVFICDLCRSWYGLSLSSLTHILPPTLILLPLPRPNGADRVW